MTKLWRDLTKDDTPRVGDRVCMPSLSIGNWFEITHEDPRSYVGFLVQRPYTDPRLSDDPLTALKAVMERHNLEIDVVEGMTVWSGGTMVLDVDSYEESIRADHIPLNKPA